MASNIGWIHVPTVGMKFKSYDDVENYIHDYGTSERQLFVKKRGSILTAVLKRPDNERLVYFHVEYGCKYGGSYRNKSSGKRATSTYKIECPASIVFHISKDKCHLEIKRVNLSHENHNDATTFYELLPEVRRLASDQREEVVELLKLRCDKKIVRAKLEKESGKKVTMKDLSNIQSTLKQQDDLEEMVERLQQKGATTHILTTEGRFKGLYFSTPDMRNSMGTWPQVVFIDGTYKLLKMNLTVMILLVEDSNASSEIVGVGLLAREDYVTFKWFLETFKKENSLACGEINCVMGDKDLLEREVLKEVLPNIPIYICLFHTLKTFSREISREKMNLSTQERNKCLKILEQLAYSSSESKYDEIYAKLRKVAPRPVRDYFDKNWHGNREEWTCYSMVSGNLHNRTNNRLESINGKIKQVVKKCSSLVDFVDSFFVFLESHEHHVNLKTSKSFTRRPTTYYPTDSAERQYMNILTDEAFKYVLVEINAIEAIKIINQSDGTFIVEEANLPLHISLTSCDCGIAKSSLLPCRHIFAIRKHCEVPLFAEELCHKRWTKAYCKENQRSFKPAGSLCDMAYQFPTITDVHSEDISTDRSRKKRLVAVTNDLKMTCSQSCGSDFACRYEILTKIKNLWAKDCQFTVKIGDSGKYDLVSEKNKKKRTVPEKRKLVEPLLNALLQLGLQSSEPEFESRMNTLKKIESLWRRQQQIFVEEIGDTQERFLSDQLPIGQNSADELTKPRHNHHRITVHESIVERFQRLLNVNGTSDTLARIQMPEAAKVKGRPSRNLDTWVNTKSRQITRKGTTKKKL